MSANGNEIMSEDANSGSEGYQECASSSSTNVEPVADILEPELMQISARTIEGSLRLLCMTTNSTVAQLREALCDMFHFVAVPNTLPNGLGEHVIDRAFMNEADYPTARLLPDDPTALMIIYQGDKLSDDAATLGSLNLIAPLIVMRLLN